LAHPVSRESRDPVGGGAPRSATAALAGAQGRPANRWGRADCHAQL